MTSINSFIEEYIINRQSKIIPLPLLSYADLLKKNNRMDITEKRLSHAVYIWS